MQLCCVLSTCNWGFDAVTDGEVATQSRAVMTNSGPDLAVEFHLNVARIRPQEGLKCYRVTTASVFLVNCESS